VARKTSNSKLRASLGLQQWLGVSVQKQKRRGRQVEGLDGRRGEDDEKMLGGRGETACCI
jgi:hypothetical protein